MFKVILLCLVVTAASFKKDSSSREFIGFFSKLMPIDTTSATCGTEVPALLYAFQNDSTRSAPNKLFLYGLAKCPTAFNQELFNYNNKIKITYRECTKEDLQNVEILNRRRFFNVRYYLITAIEAAN